MTTADPASSAQLFPAAAGNRHAQAHGSKSGLGLTKRRVAVWKGVIITTDSKLGKEGSEDLSGGGQQKVVGFVDVTPLKG